MQCPHVWSSPDTSQDLLTGLFPSLVFSTQKIKISFLLLFQSESQAFLEQSYRWMLNVSRKSYQYELRYFLQV